MVVRLHERGRRLMGASWPERFPIVQFPNPPLILALVASGAARASDGEAHRVLLALFYAGLSVWAYEEAARGVNWFRRVVGVGFAVYIVVSLAGSLH